MYVLYRVDHQSLPSVAAASGCFGDGCHGDDDVDVAAERRRVLHGSGRHDLLHINNLSKVMTDVWYTYSHTLLHIIIIIFFLPSVSRIPVSYTHLTLPTIYSV